MKTKEIFMYALGSLISLGFFATLIYLIYTKTEATTINLALGALIAAFINIVGYFFGSSKGSSDKNDLLAKKKE